MAIRKIAMMANPILKAVCSDVTKFDDGLKEIIIDMKDTLFSTKTGVGIAAPQIGIAKRIIVVKEEAIVNPVITKKSGEQIIKEGCLSYPGIQKHIKRPLQVTVAGKDENGKDLSATYQGIYAAIACHEVDHLNGQCKVGQRQKSFKPSNKKKKGV